MNERLIQTRHKLDQYGQTHLLLGYENMTSDQQAALLDSIDSIDFELMQSLYQMATQPVIEEQTKVEPVEYVEKDSFSPADEMFYESLGADVIRAGKMAAVTMAGGQGTRLGHDGPKGTFVFDKENGKSIFEALTDTLLGVCKKYGVSIPWYIMTSFENNAATVKFFEDNNYFGYVKEDVIFFNQGELPMLDFNGKILLNPDYTIKKAANGHGGTLISMESVMSDMKARGVEWVSINGVDNVLVQPIDALFIGYTVYCGAMAGTKSIPKSYPEEKVGVLCKKNGKVGVIEYTEISKHMSELRDHNGKLVYGNAYALFNLFSMKCLDRIAEIKLPYHVAVKKANYIDQSGALVEAKDPNAYKFEQFLFDAFVNLNPEQFCVCEVDRDSEFAPIKNAEGKDSPETALELYRKKYPSE